MIESATLEMRTVRLPERTVAYIRHVGPYAGNGALFDRLFKQVRTTLEALDLVRDDSEAITMYHDDPETVPADRQRISVGYTVPTGSTANDGIQVMTLPESDYAIGCFSIPPGQYSEAWTTMFGYIAENGLEPNGGPMYESYRGSPGQNDDGLHEVDICIAVKSRRGS